MEKVDMYEPVSPNDRTARILHAFHTYLPADGRVNFLHRLQSLHTNQQLQDHAESLINGLVTPLRSLRSDPFDWTGLTLRESRLKTECLTRDGARCVVTGFFDEESLDKSSTCPTVVTECVNIIPCAMSSWITKPESHAKDIIWTNLIHHFPAIRSMNFHRDSINDTKNAMTMSIALSYHFGRFDFSFEATSQPHRYRIQNYSPRNQINLPRTVAFNCYDQRYDLPSPELLKVHAAIARIFHVSGVADNIEKALRDLGVSRMLAEDGSTDISSMLAATTIGILASCADNVQQTRAVSPDYGGLNW